MDTRRKSDYLWGEVVMKKDHDESWLHYFARLLQDLVRNETDAKYWANVFAMTAAACLAVAFIEASSLAFYVGLVCSLYGLKFNRRGGGK
mgnify:FL=1